MPKKEIFVSSTFKDFQTERDLLNNDFSNIINDTLKNKIGMTVSFLDLRYGVNTYGIDEKERIKSATISSIQNVKKTKPFFIIFIGNRYGSLVDDNYLESIYRFFMNSYDKNNKSITEIEFDFSSFNSDIEIEKSHCFLIKRNIINANNNSIYFDDNQKLVENLFDKVKAKCLDINYLEYDSYINNDNRIEIDNENRSKLVNFLLDRFLNLLDENIDDNDIENNIFNSIYENENYTYIDREDTKFIYSIINENKLLNIEGKHGYGKTALICRLASKLKDENNYSYYFLTKNSIRNANISNVFRFFLRSLKNDNLITDKFNQIEKMNDLQIISYFYDAINSVNINNQIYFFIDDIDKLIDYQANNLLIDTLLIPQSCHFITTSTVKINSEANVIIQDVRINDISTYFLKRASAIGKLLPENFLNKLAGYSFDNQNFYKNPLYLSMVLDNILALNEFDFIQLNNAISFEAALSELLFNRISEHNSDLEAELCIMLNKLDGNAKAIMSGLALFSDVSIDNYINYYRNTNEKFIIDDFYKIRNLLSNIIVKNYNGKYELYNDIFKPIILNYYYNGNINEINSFKYNFISNGILMSSINDKIEAYNIINSIIDIKAYELLVKYLDDITEINDNGIVHNILGDCIIEYTLSEINNNPNDNLIYNLLNVSNIKMYKKAFNYLSIYLLKEELMTDYKVKNSIKINEAFMNLCNDIGYLSAPMYKTGLTIYLLSYSYLLNFNDVYVDKGIDFCNQLLSQTGMVSYAIKIINLEFKRIKKTHNIVNIKEKIDFIPMVYQYLAGKRPSLSDILMFMDTICGVWDCIISIDINTYYIDKNNELNEILKPLIAVTDMLSNYLDKIKDYISKGDYYKYKISFVTSGLIIFPDNIGKDKLDFLYNALINERVYLLINQSVFYALEILIYNSKNNIDIINIDLLIQRIINIVDEAIIQNYHDIEVLRMIIYIYKALFIVFLIGDSLLEKITNQYYKLIDNYYRLFNKCIYSLEYKKILEELIFISSDILVINHCKNNNIEFDIKNLQSLFNMIDSNIKNECIQIMINNLYNYRDFINGIIKSTNSGLEFESIVNLIKEIIN